MIICKVRARYILSFLYIPYYLINRLYLKTFRCIDFFDIKYLILSSKIDVDQSFNFYKLKEKPIKLKIKEIKNKKVRLTLYLTSIFKKWNIYYIRTLDGKLYESDTNRKMIYISRDELNTNDLCNVFRVNDIDINKNCNRKNNQYNDSNLYIKEPDVFAIVAKKTKLHDLSYKERELIRTSKIDKELIKKTNEVIKNNINYFNSIYLKNSIIRRPFLFHLIYYNKYNLIKKILDTLSNEQKEKLVNTKCWYNDSLVSSLDVAKIDTEIYKLLEKYKDLSIYDRYYKIKKITE